MTQDKAPDTKGRLVDPMTLRGFRDYLPSYMIARNRLIVSIQSVFEKYGFVPLDTPVLELLVTLIGTGGEEVNKQMFRLESPEREPIAMRFDLTVPFARVIAQYPEEIKLPFRRYHIGPVFRADKPGPGRLRQFTQCDIDAAGSRSVAVDAEVIAAMCDVLSAVGLGNGAGGASSPGFAIRINNRKLMDGLLETCGLSHEKAFIPVLRVLDKLQKIGGDNVRRELGAGRVDDSGDQIPGVGLDEPVIDKILEFVSISGSTRGEVLDGVRGRIQFTSELCKTALEEMGELLASLDALGVSEPQVLFDPSLTRGLDYYTGPVFEGYLPTAPEYGSVMGGGRYDGLVNRFLPEGVPATGASIGLDRLMSALIETGRIETPDTLSKVIVLSMEGVPKAVPLQIAQEIRIAGLPAEVFMGEDSTGLKAQFSYANAKGIPIAVVVGPDEMASGSVSIKDLHAGQAARSEITDRQLYREAGRAGQMTVKRQDMAQAVRSLLGM